MADSPSTTVAYLTNQFPAPVEPYVVEEIQELRKRGVGVLPCSVRQPVPDLNPYLQGFAAETLFLQPLTPGLALRAGWLCLKKVGPLLGVYRRILLQGSEPIRKRVRTLLHTWLGACYALQLRERRVQHIHVHHGYFASWIAMIAAKLTGITFSMTLHGSDLLLHPAYLDSKLAACQFCMTISEFNRQYILEHYPDADPAKILLRRMGTSTDLASLEPDRSAPRSSPLLMLTVGRLHPVKDHDFLVRACRKLKDQNISFRCWIAGEGPERNALDRLIRDLSLQDDITLLGHLSRAELDSFYTACDLVVLTSRSEGIPLVLMEAMAHRRLVLVPAITGIPELVIDGRTGFLYRAGLLDDFVARVQSIIRLEPELAPVRRAARRHVLEYFNREKNLAAFCDLFLARVVPKSSTPHPCESSTATNTTSPLAAPSLICSK